MDHLTAARGFVERAFPLASTAIVAGSTARGTRTATSDIDLLLLGPSAMLPPGQDSLAATYTSGDEVFEVFAYTPESFDRWATAGVEEFRPVVVHMLVEGTPVRHGAELDDLRAGWQRVIDDGPSPSTQQIDVLRYVVTDLLDDLTDATDPLERRVVAGTLFEKTAALMLLTARQWLGTGKYAARRLRQWDPARAERLAAPFLADDVPAFASAVRRELDAAGGRLQAGFVR